MQAPFKTISFSKIKVSSKLKVLLLASLPSLAISISVASANAQTPVPEFSSANCNLTYVAIPQNATNSYFHTTYSIDLRPNISTHRWKAGASAIRITGDCQNHVIWGIGSLIGFNSQQYVEFDRRTQTSSFRPNPYNHDERFSEFAGAPKIRGQEAVYFAAQTSPPIGVWKSPRLWAINFVSNSQGSRHPIITKIATSTRKIISAIPEVFYHTQDFSLGIVQEQSDGSRIAFTFVYQQK